MRVPSLHFVAGSYRACLSAYSALSSPSPLLTTYAARAHLAQSPPNPQAAQSLLSSAPPTLDTRAVSALATYLSSESAHEDAVAELEDILTELGEQGLDADQPEAEGRFVRGIVATVWLLEGDEQRREEAAEILREAIELGQDQEW